MITVGGLFSGIGGMELGLQRAGMQIEWMVEIDDYANKVLAKHWPDVARFRDVRECGAHNLAPVDLICGGFPCQPYSVAGQRRGEADDRALWPEMRRIVSELRPAWVVGENVPGIINMALDGVLLDLENLGYETWPLVIPACAVGAPHIRSRVFILAYAEYVSVGGYQQHGGVHSDAVGDGAQGAMADADGARELQSQGSQPEFGRWFGDGGADVENAQRDGDSTQIFSRETIGPDAARSAGWVSRSGRRPIERRVCGISHELPEGLDGFDRVTEDTHGNAEESRSKEDMRVLRQEIGEEANQRADGRSGDIPETEILQSSLHGPGVRQGSGNSINFTLASTPIGRVFLRDVSDNEELGCSPQRRQPGEQYSREPDDIVRFLSSKMALGTWKTAVEETIGVQSLWTACAEIGYVPETLPALPEVWQSLTDEEKAWVGLRINTGNPWCSEWPGVSRTIAGKQPNRAARLRCLGNAVVPAIAESIGRMIVQAEREQGG